MHSAVATHLENLFLSTPSARRATFGLPKSPTTPTNFYPRPPRGGRHAASSSLLSDTPNFYPRPPRGGRPAGRPRRSGLYAISIHALREEGDPFGWLLLTVTVQFLSTPSARRATGRRLTSWGGVLFLSTPSARRATGRRHGSAQAGDHFYPRPPRGGRRPVLALVCAAFKFLSTPSARRATTGPGRRSIRTSFLSTPSARRATEQCLLVLDGLDISIHALREEGDMLRLWKITDRGYFYPRPPRGGRQRAGTPHPGSRSISIHALREEGDQPPLRRVALQRVFLSTPSARRATTPPESEGTMQAISIHALREEGDVQQLAVYDAYQISIHALREEGDLNPSRSLLYAQSFLSTPSARRATVLHGS